MRQSMKVPKSAEKLDEVVLVPGGKPDDKGAQGSPGWLNEGTDMFGEMLRCKVGNVDVELKCLNRTERDFERLK